MAITESTNWGTKHNEINNEIENKTNIICQNPKGKNATARAGEKFYCYKASEKTAKSIGNLSNQYIMEIYYLEHIPLNGMVRDMRQVYM